MSRWARNLVSPALSLSVLIASHNLPLNSRHQYQIRSVLKSLQWLIPPLGQSVITMPASLSHLVFITLFCRKTSNSGNMTPTVVSWLWKQTPIYVEEIRYSPWEMTTHAPGTAVNPYATWSNIPPCQLCSGVVDKHFTLYLLEETLWHLHAK